MSCVLLHGFTGSPAAWDAVISHWPGEDPPAALALPGHGGGAVAPTWDGNLDRIAAAIAARGAAGAPVVGYSLGARVALGLLATDRVPCAVLIGVHAGLAEPAAREARRAADAIWAERLRGDDIAAFAAAWEAQPVFATAHRADAAAHARRAAIRRSHDPRALARSLDGMGLAAMPDYRPALISRAARAHLVVGADDAKFVAIARALVAAAPALAFDVIADSGHDPSLDQPAALAAVIADALPRLVVRSART